MKKAKIFLAVITILSVAGGTLAFKAQKRTNPTLYCTTTYATVCGPKAYVVDQQDGTLMYCSTLSLGCYRPYTVTLAE